MVVIIVSQVDDNGSGPWTIVGVVTRCIMVAPVAAKIRAPGLKMTYFSASITLGIVHVDGYYRCHFRGGQCSEWHGRDSKWRRGFQSRWSKVNPVDCFERSDDSTFFVFDISFPPPDVRVEWGWISFYELSSRMSMNPRMRLAIVMSGLSVGTFDNEEFSLLGWGLATRKVELWEKMTVILVVSPVREERKMLTISASCHF